MLHKAIFKLGYSLKRPNVLKYYNDYKDNSWRPFEELKAQQDMALRDLVDFAYRNVPYYTKLFRKLRLKPNDIKSTNDLQKLPILSKHIIKENWQDFLPANIDKIKFVNSSTGGSTGEPLKYRMSLEDYERGIALRYRGWGYGGYKLGDKVAIIAGSSLIPRAGSAIHKRLQGYMLNTQFYSSFGMSENTLLRYFKDINRVKPRFIRGYASSIYLLTNFIRSKGLDLNFQPQAIFTTAEKLLDHQREIIEEVLEVKVFDNYGLNDGGVSAYECESHDGRHIDMERAILEVVAKDNRQIIGKPGKILATSLYNYACPFIRYDTGDIGTMVYSHCSCGRQMPLLKEIVGRTTDVLELNGKQIGSPVLTVLFGKFDIEQYQIIQETEDSIICRIVKGKTYRNEDEKFIQDSFRRHVGSIDIVFDYVPLIQSTGEAKHKFITNNTTREA